jgi:hypothetical protein
VANLPLFHYMINVNLLKDVAIGVIETRGALRAAHIEIELMEHGGRWLMKKPKV